MKLILPAMASNQSWEKNAERNGFEVVVLLDKEQEKRDYFANFEDPNEVVCWIKSGDHHMVVGTSKEMLDKYEKKKSVLLVSDDCYLGPVSSMMNLEAIDQEKADHDLFYRLPLDLSPMIWHWLVMTNRLSMHPIPLENRFYRMENRRLVVREKNERPVILHLHGDDRWIREHLDLPLRNCDGGNVYTNRYRREMKKRYSVLFKILYIMLIILHGLMVIFIYSFVFFVRSPFWISFFVVIWFCMVLNWYIFGKCALTYLEDFVSAKDTGYSSLMIYLNRAFGKTFSFYLTTVVIPLSLVIFALHKLNRVYRRERQKK